MRVPCSYGKFECEFYHMKNQGKYIYSVIKEAKPRTFSVSGMENRPVHTINYKGWGAVVSDSPLNDFLITREYTMAHQRVMEEVMRRGYDILPVSFGTVAGKEDDIKEKILKQKREELEKSLSYIKGKMELNLKVLWQDVRSVFNEIAQTNPSVRSAKHSLKNGAMGRFAIAQIGEIVKNALEERREKLAGIILSRLRPLAVEMNKGDILQDAMILNTTFLVPKSCGRTYDRRVLELAKEYGDKMNFMNYGPLPPYNFVSVKVSFKD